MSKVVHRVSASVLILVTGLLPVSQSVAGESTVQLTLKTRYTKATCLLTHNGADATGVQEVTMPDIDSHDGWGGDTVPLNLGMRCGQLPEEDLGITLTVTPEWRDANAGAFVIASRKTTGNNVPGPDLLLVDINTGSIVETSSPELVLPGKKCSVNQLSGGVHCLPLIGNPQNYRIPLGIRQFVPAAGKSDFNRSDMLTPGTWSTRVILNISYQ
ncbi:hypothetical protein QL374_003663 [Salmonella enterica]|nr:hypothetical protein [Salmonella enterica]ELW6563313.1 hypothetical protein [Salmonella enterica]ELZ1404532.1 hypothetical protein [Salmonella enterica]